MKLRHSIVVLTALAPVLAFAIPGGAHAQEVTADAGEDDTGAAATVSENPGDIIVTASKRAENLQRVPQAVQVVSGTQLESLSVRDFADLTRIAPSLVIRPESQPSTAAISIRGIGTYAFGIGVEPSVTVQVDDVPVSVQSRAFADLQDVARIEVLRGPQSTLYGKAASAGIINIFTEGPTKDFTLRVNAFGTNDQEFGGGLTVAGPIGKEVGYRVSTSYVDYRGNVRNLFDGDYVNGRQVFTLRGKLLWESAAGVTVTLGANYIDGTITNGRPFVRLSPNARLRGNAAIPPSVFAPGIVPSDRNDEASINFVNTVNYWGAGQSLRLEYEFADGPTLLSITSYDYYKSRDDTDHDETSSAAIDNRSIASLEAKQLTQEVRLVAPGSQSLRYTLGIFYVNNKLERIFQRGPVFALARWDATAGSDQISAFGQLDFDVTSSTTLIGGLRVQREEIDYTFLDYLAARAFFSGEADDTFYTYRLGVRQQLATDISAFATYSTGHKGQTFDLTTGFNRNRQLAGPVRPETSKSFEAGLRAQFLDRAVTLNATVFSTNYRDFQSQGIDTLPDGTQNFRLTNVGRVRTRGLEVETTIRPSNQFSVNGSLAYLDATITEFQFAQCYPGQTAAQGCSGSPASQDLKGFRPANAPEWKATAGFDLTQPLSSTLDTIIQGSFTYQSRINYTLSQDPEAVQGAYSLTNLSVGLRDTARKFEITAFVNNIFDTQYYGNLINLSGSFGGAQATAGLVTRDFGRYGGLRVRYSY